LPVTKASSPSVPQTKAPLAQGRRFIEFVAASPYLAFALLVLQPLLFYRRHLFARTVHIPYDIQMFHLPLAWFIARCARQHILPLWDPFSYCGVPIHADIQAQLFYPVTWIAILVSNAGGGQKLFYWLEWMNPLHMILGGIFGFLLLKKLRCTNWVAFFGATVYQIGPFFVSQAEHLGAISSGAWFPLTVLSVVELAERFTKRWLAILACSIAMSFLSGFPATTLAVLILTGFFCIGLAIAKQANWRLLLSYAGGCALGGAIAAVQLLPTMQLTNWSLASLRYQWKGNGGGLHWQALASFFWPNYYHIFSPFDHARFKLPYEFTFLYTYCGHLALILILVSPFFFRKSRTLAVTAVLFAISLVWMLGENTPIYPPIFHRLPHFLQGSLYAEYFLLGFSLFAAMMAALVLSRFSIKIPAALFALLIAANSWSLLKMGANRTFNTADDGWKVATRGWVDGGYPMPATVERWSHAAYPPLRTDFLDHDELDLRARAEMVQLPTADGDNPFMPLRYYHLRMTYAGDVFWSRLQLLHSFNTPWIRALNVGYVFENGSAPKRAVPPGGDIEPLPFQWVRGYRVTDPMPRFYLAKHLIPVRNENDALAAVKQPGFDPAKQTVVEGLDTKWADAGEGSAAVRVVSYENNRVEVEVDAPSRSFLVTSETLYPGWKATVNGHAAAILPTNVAFRGLPLEAGMNRIVMTYFPGLLIVALIVSLLASAATILLLALRVRQRAA
jgi:hypothetical protein